MREFVPAIPERLNLATYYLDRHLAEGRGNKIAIIYGDRKITYREVAEQVNRAANAFKRVGLRPRDRVLLMLLDSPAFVTAFWGAIKLGAIPVPVNTLLTAEDFEFMLKDSQARGLVVESALLDKVVSLLGGLPHLRSVWVVGRAPTRCLIFEQELTESSPEAAAASTRRDEPSFWLYTSGSTGRPKAAVHCHRGMVYCLETYGKQVLGIRPQDITFSTSKLFFAYGLGNTLHFPFGVGAMTVLLSEKPTAGRIFATLRRYRPTIFFAVPSIYASMLHEAGGSKLDFASVRRAISAGEALPAPLWTQFRERFGVSIIDGIGSTEMLHMFISNRPDDTVPGSSGRPVPGYKVKIVNERGKAVAAGQMGELWVSGGSAAKGYWRRQHLTRSTFRGKWTYTGDKYIQDERGYFWHCGRSDDMLKVSGLWVSPLEIETALLAHPDVLECAVVGASDSDGLTKPKAFVVLKPSSRSPVEAETEIAAFLRSRLPGYKIPQWIVLVETLPRTATGKIQRFKLREQTSRLTL